jgi:hypothetical protein
MAPRLDQTTMAGPKRKAPGAPVAPARQKRGEEKVVFQLRSRSLCEPRLVRLVRGPAKHGLRVKLLRQTLVDKVLLVVVLNAAKNLSFAKGRQEEGILVAFGSPERRLEGFFNKLPGLPEGKCRFHSFRARCAPTPASRQGTTPGHHRISPVDRRIRRAPLRANPFPAQRKTSRPRSTKDRFATMQ